MNQRQRLHQQAFGWLKKQLSLLKFIGRKKRTEIPSEVREQVWKRDGDICQCCFRHYDSQHRRRTIHHINGDPSDHRFDRDRTQTTLNNLVGCCEPCQKGLHHKSWKRKKRGGRK